MTQRDNSSGFLSKLLKPLRLALLASVAGTGIAVLGATVDSPRSASWIAPAAAATEQAAQPLGFADLVARVKPAVISVRVRFESAAQTSSEDSSKNNEEALPFRQGSPLDRFFRQFGFKDRPQTQRPVGGEGSGFFISADGYAVTNNHVVDHTKTVEVVTDDGRTLPAKVIGTDPNTDLALIKVEGKNFPYVKFADHEPRIGDWVVAVGNPFGLGGTVTAGIVSAMGRDIGAGPYDDFIQIDAPINKGNSGGPTFDINGNVIGVNTAIYSPDGGSVGIGFDVPADTAKKVVAQLEEHGHVVRGWLGVQIQPVTTGIADSLGMKKVEGAIVDEAQSNSPAAKAGVMTGDVITAVNGKEVKDSRDLARRIAPIAPGTSVQLAVLRNGKDETVTVTLGQLPDQRQAKANDQNGTTGTSTPGLGLSVAPAKDIDGAGTQGVAVTEVNPDGPAAEQGIRTGDVILDVAGKAVATPADIRKELGDLNKAGRHTALLHVKSGNTTRFVAVPFGKA
jgi:serine protease Do